MVGDYKLLKILDSLRTAVMDDGRVTLGETSVILRTIRPFVLKGEPGACELDALLQRVRSDGVVTDEESNQIAQLMDNLLSGRPRLADYVREIRDIARALNVSNGKLEQGNMRADVNISLREWNRVL